MLPVDVLHSLTLHRFDQRFVLKSGKSPVHRLAEVFRTVFQIGKAGHPINDFYQTTDVMHNWQIAKELGDPRLVNTILIGVLSNHLPFTPQQWTEAIRKRVKAKFVDINLSAFERGRQIKLEKSTAAR